MFLQLVYHYGHTFSKERDQMHTLITMILRYLRLVCTELLQITKKQPNVIDVIAQFILLVNV